VVYAGRIALDDNGKPVKASWPAIVDVKTWRAVQAILSDPARKTTPGTTPKHLCSGIIHCGKCGAKMRSGAGWATRGRKVQTYRRTRDECGVTVQRDLVDGQVKKAVVEAFESGEPLGADDGDDAARQAIEIELEEARAAETRLADAIADNVISADAARARSALIKADVERLAGELQAIQQRSAKAGMLTAGYAEMLQALPSDRPEYWGDPAHAEELVGWLHLHTYERHEGLSRVQAMEKVVAAVHTGELQRRFDALPLEKRRNLVRSLLRITVAPWAESRSGPHRARLTRRRGGPRRPVAR
jgi:hypothetical protein